MEEIEGGGGRRKREREIKKEKKKKNPKNTHRETHTERKGLTETKSQAEVNEGTRVHATSSTKSLQVSHTSHWLAALCSTAVPRVPDNREGEVLRTQEATTLGQTLRRRGFRRDGEERNRGGWESIYI